MPDDQLATPSDAQLLQDPSWPSSSSSSASSLDEGCTTSDTSGSTSEHRSRAGPRVSRGQFRQLLRQIRDKDQDITRLKAQVASLIAGSGYEWMQSQLEHERDISRRITRVATRYKTESRRASHEALSLTEELEATRQNLEIDRERFEAAEDNLERVEEQLNAERARTENFEQQLREERERLVSTRERLHLQHQAHLEEKAGLVDQLRSMSDQIDHQEQELQQYRESEPTLSAQEISDLQLKLSRVTRELHSTINQYTMLDDRHSKLENEKAAIAEQLKSYEAELAAQRADDKTSAALQSSLALARSEASMAMHKLSVTEARLAQEGRAHEQLKASSLAIIRPIIAFDLARYFFTACDLKNHHPRFVVERGQFRLSSQNWHWSQQHNLWRLSARNLGIPDADAVAINSIDLAHERNLAAHTTLADVVSRAELLDQLGGTTLSKTFVPLLDLERLKSTLATRIRELDALQPLHPGEEVEVAPRAGSSALGLGGMQRVGGASVEEEEDSTTPRARTVSLPQLQDDPAFSPLLRESSWPELAASPPTRDSRALPSVIRRPARPSNGIATGGAFAVLASEEEEEVESE